MRKLFVVALSFSIALLFQQGGPNSVLSQQAPTEVRIGTSQPLTGAFSPSGTKTHLGMMMAQDYVNKVKGGVFVKQLNKRLPLRVVSYDDRTEASRAKSLAERLIKADQVHGLVAPFGSGLAIAIAPVAEANKMPMVAPAAWSDAIYDKGYRYTFNPYILASDEGRVAIDLFHQMNQKLTNKWNSLALLYSEDPYASTVAVGVRDRVKKYNYQIVLDQGIPRGTLDFGPLILKMKTVNPDLVFYMDNAVAANIKMIQQMRDLGFNTKLLYFPVASDNADTVMEHIKDIAAGLTGHTHSANHVFPGQEELWKWFIKEAEAKGYPVSAWPAVASTITSGFLCVQLLVEAIERAGSLDGVKIRNALAETDGVYISGPIRFGPNGVNDKYTLILVQLQQGEWVTIFPEKIDGIDLKPRAVAYPKPAWP